jgi:hypothetical protein
MCGKSVEIFLLNMLVHTVTQRLQKVKRRYIIRKPILVECQNISIITRKYTNTHKTHIFQ